MRFVASVLAASAALVAAAPASAAFFGFVGTVTSSTVAGIEVGDEFDGRITTDRETYLRPFVNADFSSVFVVGGVEYRFFQPRAEGDARYEYFYASSDRDGLFAVITQIRTREFSGFIYQGPRSDFQFPNKEYSTGTLRLAGGEINFSGSLVAVPETATWALMIGGFGLVGTALRRRKSTNATEDRSRRGSALVEAVG